MMKKIFALFCVVLFLLGSVAVIGCEVENGEFIDDMEEMEY